MTPTPSTDKTVAMAMQLAYEFAYEEFAYARTRDGQKRQQARSALESFLCAALAAPAESAAMPEGQPIAAPAAEPPKLATRLQIDLDDDALELLKGYIEATDEPSPLTLIVGDGHSGYGLYMYETEVPDEGAVLVQSLAAPPTAAQSDEARARRGLPQA